MKVICMDAIFHISLCLPHYNIYNFSCGQNNTQMSALVCTLPRSRKTTLSTTLCTEMDLVPFLKVAYIDVIFQLDLVRPFADIQSMNYDKKNHT